MSLYVDFHTEVKVNGKWINIDPIVYNIKKKENVRVSTYWNGSRTYISDTLHYFMSSNILTFDELGEGTKEIYQGWDKEELSWDQFSSMSYQCLSGDSDYDSSMVLRADVAEQFEKGEINEDDAYNFGRIDTDVYTGPVKVVKYNTDTGANYHLDIIKKRVDERKRIFENANMICDPDELEYRVVAVWS